MALYDILDRSVVVTPEYDQTSSEEVSLTVTSPDDMPIDVVFTLLTSAALTVGEKIGKKVTVEDDKSKASHGALGRMIEKLRTKE